MVAGLSPCEKRLLLTVAREAITARLEHRLPVELAVPESLSRLGGAFVTLRIRGALRGCIGHMVASKSLVDTVREMAVEAAFRDPRFTPLTAHELPRVRIELSLLGPLERVGKIEEIIVGEHGLYVKRGGLSGVLLPQVAPEQGWDVLTFLSYVCRKACLPQEAWKEPETELYRFCALVFAEGEPGPLEQNEER